MTALCALPSHSLAAALYIKKQMAKLIPFRELEAWIT